MLLFTVDARYKIYDFNKTETKEIMDEYFYKAKFNTLDYFVIAYRKLRDWGDFCST